MAGVRTGVRRVSTETVPAIGRIRRLTVAAMVVALVVLSGSAAFQARREADLGVAQDDALAAAIARLPDLLGYEHATLSEDLDRALDQTTGDFSDDYERILDGVVEPTAARRKISTSASVSAAGVVPGQDAHDRVVVLVFLNQSTTARDSDPAVTGSRVEVTMVRVGEEWKIAGLEPV